MSQKRKWLCLFNLYRPFVYLCRPGPYNGALDLGIWKIFGFSWVIWDHVNHDICILHVYYSQRAYTMICKRCWWEYCSTISFVKHMIVIWSLFYSSCMDSFLWIYSMDRFPCQVDILLCLSDVFMKGNQLRRYRRYFFKKVRLQTYPQPRFVFLVICLRTCYMSLSKWYEKHSKPQLLL